MQEIEAKILEVDIVSLRNKLDQLGATDLGEHELDGTYYDMPSDQTLRIRKEGSTWVVCHKKILSEKVIRTSEETEFSVEDDAPVRKLFEQLGYTEKMRMKKLRHSWELEGASIILDTYLSPYDKVPPFIEIEAQSNEEVERLAALLGYEKKQLTEITGEGVFAHYGLKWGMS